MARDTGRGRVRSRRRFLAGAGATGVVALAGCLTDDGGDGGDGGSGGGDGSDGGDGGDGGSGDGGDGGTTAGDGEQMETIVLGGSMSLSGDNADLGQLYADSYEHAIQRINENGGVEAGDGNTYELEMILRDDETDASKSKTIYQDLIDREGVKFLVGPYSSTVTLPASAVAAQNQLPMVEGGGASPEIFSQGNEFIFGLLPTADKYPLSGIQMASEQSSAPESAALLAEDDTFSQSTADGARAKFEEVGIELAVDETFPTETSDLSTNLGKVRDADVDVLLLAAHQKHAIILAKQMESQDVNPDMAMATVGSLNESFKDEVGANGDYVYGPSSWANNADFDDYLYGSTTEYGAAIEEAYGYAPDYHNAAGTAVIQTYQKAFEQVDSLSDPVAVRDAIRDIEFTCAYGNIAYGDNGVIQKDMLVYQWQPDADPARQIVYPTSVQQSEPIYPAPTWDER